MKRLIHTVLPTGCAVIFWFGVPIVLLPLLTIGISDPPMNVSSLPAMTLDDWRSQRPTTRLSPQVIAMLQAQEASDLEGFVKQHRVVTEDRRIVVIIRPIPGQFPRAVADAVEAGAKVRGSSWASGYFEILADERLDSLRKLAYSPSVGWIDLPTIGEPF